MVVEGTGVLPADGWEVNVAGTMEPQGRSRLFGAPELDVNYGVTNRLLVSVTWPWRVRDRPALASQQAPGRVDLGLKALVVDGGRGLSVSTYPLLGRGTHDPGDAAWLQQAWGLRLPVQVSRQVGPVALAGEVAYTIVEAAPNEISYGVVARLPVHDRLQLAGEVGSAGPTDLSVDDALFVNGGVTATLLSGPPALNLNLSTGRLLSPSRPANTTLFAFVGVQVLF
jgi:hypothetical protein